jgi:predicted dehydrogenase
MDYIQPGVDDVVFLSIVYPGKIIANVHVSWLNPQKVRRMTIVGTRKMVIYDDIADDKIAIYDKGIEKKAILGQDMDFDNPQHAQFSYRSGGIVMPHIMFAEPLRVEAEHFLDCIRNGHSPITDISHARTVVSILEQARPYDGPTDSKEWLSQKSGLVASLT